MGDTMADLFLMQKGLVVIYGVEHVVASVRS
jgi:hypothetical protein